LVVENQSRSLDKKASMKIHKNFIDYNPVFRFAHFIQTSGFYRKFSNRSFFPFRLLTIIVGPFVLNKGFPTVEKAWKFLYPKQIIRKVNLKRWALELISYVFEMFLDVTFFIPNHNFKTINKYVKMEGYDEIVKALQKNKGVLIPFIHVGEMYHPISVLTHTKIKIHDKIQKNGIVVIASKENEFLFQPWLKRCDNLYIVITADFKTLSGEIEEHLRNNRCVFIMQDYFKNHQLRVPFIYGSKKFNFLIPCPQLLTYCHNKIGTPIVPCFTIPQKDMTRSYVKFFPMIDINLLDPEKEPPEIREDLLKLRENKLNYRKQNGLLSLKINQLLYPYAIKYPYYWQMIYTLFKRSSYKIKFDKIQSYYEFYSIILIKLKNFIEKSYEPGRKDNEILEIINRLNEEIKPMSEDPKAHFNLHKKYIEIGLLSSQAAVNKVTSIALSKQNQYIKRTYPQIQQLFLDLIHLF